jgi:hypothetical protein
MKHQIGRWVFAVVASLASPVMAMAQDVPEAVWSDYADAGWTIVAQASGDLSRDGTDDIAFVIEAPEGESAPDVGCAGQDDNTDAAARRLIVAFADGSGGYDVSANDPGIVFRADEGGTMGDPLQDITIDNGSVVLWFSGGSRWRWNQVLRFRFDDDAWRMAGMTEVNYDSIYNSIVEYDYNALTGKFIVSVAESPDPEGRRTEPVCVACRIGETCPEKSGCYQGTKRAVTGKTALRTDKRERVVMADFRCWNETTGLLAHTGFHSQR